MPASSSSCCGIVTELGFIFGFLVSPVPLIQVRRQRVVEQEEMLKECQQQTQQLQSWLTNIARTLDEATRLNDQSQLQVTNILTPLFL